MEMTPPKRCAVCGDKALGYNFNAVTCESCKAFFRRNALAKKQFTCPFSQNCEITVVTRRFCQRCRLKKCLDIGMKSENIMSEEDKKIKRRKIEINRAKRQEDDGKPRRDGGASDSTTSFHDTTSRDDSQSSFDSGKGTASNNSNVNNLASPISGSVAARSPTLSEPDIAGQARYEKMSSEEIVEFIVCDPDRASQAISKLMRTKNEALAVLEKILTSQKDALHLVSHLITFPGDALKIISKIMNSPFDALTVFTKFMSSPTDALEIISKIVSSPQDVVLFIRSLMESPEDALDIMNKFMNTPAEALRIINRILNKLKPPSDEFHKLLLDASTDNEEAAAATTTPKTTAATFQTAHTLSATETPETENDLLHSILDGSSPTSMAQEMTKSHLHPTTTTKTEASIGMEIAAGPTMAFANYGATNLYMNRDSYNVKTAPQTLQGALPYDVTTPTTATTTTTEIAEQISAAGINTNIELPSSSAGLINISAAHTNLTTHGGAVEYCHNNFDDMKSFIQKSFPDHATTTNGKDSLNSLESVLSEVIRIEFQAFNNLPAEPRVRQEQSRTNHIAMSNLQNEHKRIAACGYTNNIIDYNAEMQQQQQPICSTSTATTAATNIAPAVEARDLNEAEQMKLRELKLASEALYYPMDLSMLMMGDERIKPEEANQDPKLLQVINLTAVAIKRLIKMAKKINAFRDMCQEDQVALLKGGCTEMMIMRSILTYDNNCNMWKLPHVSNAAHIRADILKQAKGNIYEEILKFVSNFDEKLRTDENIILIMCAIVLFTPTRERVIHADVIRLEQNSYLYLLRRYLESVYCGCEAKSAFISLIQKISEIEHLNQFVIGVYLNVNPSHVEPLLREIFDLKNH